MRANADLSENKMGVMPVGKLLWVMSWPAMLSMLIHSLYNVVDSIFLAAVSEDALTAVTLAFPIQMLLIAFGAGTGIGINSLIARRLGAKRLEEANLAASVGFRLSFFGGVVFAAFGLFFSGRYIRMFSDHPYTVESGTSYLTVVCVCSVFVLTVMSVEKIMQATGNMVAPMICSLTGAAVNIALDPIFIFGLFGVPRLEVLGAAIATVIGQFVSLCLGLTFLFTKTRDVRVRLSGFPMSRQTIKDIYAVGLPAILMQCIGSVMLFFLNGILAAISSTAVAVLGAYFRLQSFIFLPVIGIMQGAMPILGYNFGAGNKKRLMTTFQRAFGASLALMVFGLILFQVFPRQLLAMFSASAQMLAIGIPALRLVSLCFPAAAFGIMASTLFQATGHGMLSLWGNLIRALLGVVPLAWLLAGTANGAFWVWAAFPLAEALAVVYCLIALRHIYRKKIAPLTPRLPQNEDV